MPSKKTKTQNITQKTKQKTNEAINIAKKKLSATGYKIKNFIEENPVKSVLIAIAVGMIIASSASYSQMKNPKKYIMTISTS